MNVDFPTETEKIWVEMFFSQLQSLPAGQELTTGFLDPYRRRWAELALQKAKHLSYTVYGGYSGAQRACLHIFPAHRRPQLPPISTLRITLEAGQGEPNPEMMRGLLLKQGLLREQLGDLRPLSGNELILFTLNPVALLIGPLLKKGGLLVQCSLSDPLPETFSFCAGRDISGTVAGLRLDAVIGLGFNLSRSRAAVLIKEGLVAVNRQLVRSPAARLGEGDRISLSGRGGLILKSLTGKTRKGRQRIILTKFSEGGRK